MQYVHEYLLLSPAIKKTKIKINKPSSVYN